MDGLGSTRTLTDASGALTDGYQYDAWGNLINQPGFTENEFLFTGEQFDAELENYYLRARFYDPRRGRFRTQDPFSGDDRIPLTLHRFIYAGNDPTNNVDPSGRQYNISTIGTALIVSGILAVTTVSVQQQVGISRADKNLDGVFTTAPRTGLATEAFLLMESVSRALQELLVFNTKHTKEVINALLAQAEEHANKIGAAPPEDPNQNPWKKEVKAFLERAKRLAEKRLKGKAKEVVIAKIEQIAARAGVILG